MEAKTVPERNNITTYPPPGKRKRTESSPYRKGDQVNLRDLLFTQERDFLIKNNTDELVKVEQLEGKVIVLHFVLLDPSESWRWTNTAQLAELYTELLSSSTRPFEVVFIAVSDDPDPSHKQRFQEIFSSMPPWPAVPFSDSIAREHLAKSFVYDGGGYLPRSIVISKTGVVLQTNGLPLFRGYGADGYPFSDKRITHLTSEDDEVRECPSLKSLLVSPQRDYVINNKGIKVSVCDLEDKVVALYLYEEGWTNELTIRLKKVYEQCLQQGKKFEVVLIYICETYNTYGLTDAESFTETFGTMPWLALPFKDTNCKKVLRICRYPFELGGPQPDPSLVIIGPRGEFFEPFGASVLMNFGMEAYPFTCDEACRLQVEKVKKLKLEMLFGPKAVFVRDTKIFPDDDEVHVLKLNSLPMNKTIIVFSDTSRNLEYAEFRKRLLERYKESKAEFEVIYIGTADVPWLKFGPGSDVDTTLEIFQDIFHYSGYGILVFDGDRKVARATSNPRGFETRCSDSGNLGVELVDDLNHFYNWNYWERQQLSRLLDGFYGHFTEYV